MVTLDLRVREHGVGLDLGLNYSVLQRCSKRNYYTQIAFFNANPRRNNACCSVSAVDIHGYSDCAIQTATVVTLTGLSVP